LLYPVRWLQNCDAFLAQDPTFYVGGAVPKPELAEQSFFFLDSDPISGYVVFDQCLSNLVEV
jgi:hypothetical protein